MHPMPSTWSAGITIRGGFQPNLPNHDFNHAFVVRLNAAGTALEYATYLTGSKADQLGAIAVDSSGAAVIAGATTSADFPITMGAYNHTYNGQPWAAFLARLKPD